MGARGEFGAGLKDTLLVKSGFDIRFGHIGV
jgi:hypothetical protein